MNKTETDTFSSFIICRVQKKMYLSRNTNFEIRSKREKEEYVSPCSELNE